MYNKFIVVQKERELSKGTKCGRFRFRIVSLAVDLMARGGWQEGTGLKNE